ncbi:phosphonate C-P lyase system protein PhnH [Fulvimarina sp. 2208YS6-2-32]|uniref:Phosphonate C-P lyase system protein PhnH n=1 Tax=Fulvimarina uroteuthidis TaxID=3098149 RepID=A0ABU5I4N0_9HYPH|nr:phosphonate C-P lyase system protein PhnH [Fulvimarina sp. 2208YS6-2-32]MDY8109893.1 phosphonate C-P lyase system protein PhnH [Fulvimarina sp. 2208YS6-2-32]
MSDARSALSVEGGFADSVFDAQGVFAKLLAASSRPGTLVDLGPCCHPPAPLSVAAGALLLTIADGDTPVFFEECSDAVEAWLAFHTGARPGEADNAHFAVVSKIDREWLRRLRLGTLAYPDLSATVLVETDSLAKGDPFVLEGPGIENRLEVSIAGLPGDLVEFRTANRALFPCGLDLILTCGSALLALPRSTVVMEA